MKTKRITAALTIFIAALLVLLSTVSAQAQDFVCCTDFNDNNQQGWSACPSPQNNVDVSLADPGPSGASADIYLSLKDESGGSLVCGPSGCLGDWTTLLSQGAQGCGAFCYDVQIFNDACETNNTIDPHCIEACQNAGCSLAIPPRLIIRSGTLTAVFKPSFTITEPGGANPGWHTLCAPIGLLDNQGQLPSNADGFWEMSGGAPATAWNDLITDVTAIQLPIDFSSNPAEVAGYDNLCLRDDVCPTAPTTGLKVCKVAGEGVAVGTLFDFLADNAPVSVPAGPMPGGYCKVVPGSFAEGNLTVKETGPDGYTVTGISVRPSGWLVGAPDLPGKQVTVNLGSGITEVTFTNEWHIGWLEICKEGDTSGDFSFTLSPSLASAGPFTVPAGACTPAIEVPSGTITITEVAVSGVTMLSCRTIPADRQGECNPKARTSKVKIIPGDISTQTIAFIENRGIGENDGRDRQ